MSAALRFQDREIAPQAFDDAVRRVAGGLERLGIGEGDVVGIMLHNVPAFLESMRAARMLGAFFCTINWHYRSEEAGWILRDSGAKALVIDPALHAQIAQAVPERLPIVDGADWEGWRGAQPAWQGAERRPGTLMPYTSGTTGRAKGVRRLAPPAAQAYAGLLQQVLGIEPGMRAILSAPLYHSAPAGYGLQASLHGELLVLEERFDAERTLALIERHRLTHAYLVPTMYVRLLRLPASVKDKYDLSSMRFVASTGSPCPAELKRAMIDWWGPGSTRATPQARSAMSPSCRRRKPCASRVAPVGLWAALRSGSWMPTGGQCRRARWASSTAASRRFRTSPITTIRRLARGWSARACARSATWASSTRRATCTSATAPPTW